METQLTMEECVAKYLSVFERARAKVGSDEAAAVIVEQVGKDFRVDKMHGDRQNGRASHGDAGSEKASQRQLNYLRRLGISVSEAEKLTMSEASRMIDDAKAQ